MNRMISQILFDFVASAINTHTDQSQIKDICQRKC
nr:MAG TPA: hypothetical protein [Bacteriophage sp.]